MKILFVCESVFLSEPLGLMQLSSICKQAGYDTKLTILSKRSFLEEFKNYEPDLVAYSVMTPHAPLFKKADYLLKKWLVSKNKSTVRIMGGPHPTYYPEILGECDLDAICIGEGDNAIIEIIRRVENNSNLSNIPNVLCRDNKSFTKELIQNLDALPFVDREIIYEAAPYYRAFGLRSFLASRGCPYNCSYCFNHVHNMIFRGQGKTIRRRSVDHLIDEIKYVARTSPL